MSDPINAHNLDKLAEVAVKVGLQLAEGQDLVMTSSLEAAPLARLITKHAYKSGAGLVTTLFSDSEATLMRYRYASDASFDRAADWLFDGISKAFDNNAARLAISGDNPALLADEDPDKVSRADRAMKAAANAMRKRIVEFHINWNIVAYPGLDWARQVFAGEPDAVAQEKLANAVFAASRVDVDDPMAAWAAHNANLAKRSAWLNEQNFSALHFTGPGTDLKVGLAEAHRWMGGASKARNGIVCNPNIPSEEVFTTPHARKVEGHVRSTKPLSYMGTLIRDISVRFEEGRIVEAHASQGEEILLKVLDTDDGARRLGEVALVPHSSPISQSGILFYNTLFDENAACHIALGQCYSECFVDGSTIDSETVASRGGNTSNIHIDWMIGSGEIDIDGVRADGERVPVFCKGEWA